MALKKVQAHPLLKYSVSRHPDDETLAVISFLTSDGEFHFAVLRKMLEELSQGFSLMATKMDYRDKYQ